MERGFSSPMTFSADTTQQICLDVVEVHLKPKRTFNIVQQTHKIKKQYEPLSIIKMT